MADEVFHVQMDPEFLAHPLAVLQCDAARAIQVQAQDPPMAFPLELDIHQVQPAIRQDRLGEAAHPLHDFPGALLDP
jgi:hypothetical protein